jgi:hypothetical protein
MPIFTIKFQLRSYHSDEKFDLEDFKSKEVSAQNLDELFTLLDSFDASFYETIDDASVINSDVNAELEEVAVEYVEIKDAVGTIIYKDK